MITPPVKKKIVLALAAVSGITLAPLVSAQGAGLLEEVIVTAQKREQSLQDVPVAVTAFTGEMLEKSGVKDMFDLQVNAPSLIVGQTQNSTQTTFSIRGVFTSSQNFGLEPSVGLYVDGVYRARQSSMINNLIDIASVEILRGPQGTLFGRNTPAGAIQINSAPPTFEEDGFLEATAGNYDLLSASGARSFTLIDDVLAVRATGFYMERDGFIDWVKQGNVEKDAINNRDRWGMRLQALYMPTDEVTVSVNFDHSEVDEICCGNGTWKNNFTAQNLAPGAPAVSGTDAIIAGIGGTVLDQDDFYDYAVSTSELPVSENEDQGISVQVDWELENFTLTSITAYREFESFDNGDIAFNDLDGAYRINDASQDQFTQELRIASSGDEFSYVAGLYYYQQDLENDRDTFVGANLSAMLGLPANAFIDGAGANDVNTQEHTSYAVFGQFDYNITDALVLTAGLRWTYEDKELVNIFNDDAPATFNPLEDNWGFYGFPPLTPQADVDESFDDDQVTGTIKLSWFANNDTMFYASYGTGYKSGGTNADRIPADVAVLFDAETSESIEVGMKSEFPDQALRLNVALHKTDTDDLQTISFQGGGFALINAGTAETYGGEIDLSWLPGEATTITVGYAYNHGEYADFEEGPCWTSRPFHT
ncbi:MAG: TonB-dependent receptor, partial [Halioglobus sp.]|nr:TonB-dependent receptor [Halioglobus sp.]